jgi:hypothetical protein
MKSMKRTWPVLVVLAVVLGVAPASGKDRPESKTDHQAQLLADDATRYMALGDSLAAGYLALPVTKGYVYRLYETAAFDSLDRTLFCNAAVPGATSSDVLLHQVPQALIRDGGFNPKSTSSTSMPRSSTDGTCCSANAPASRRSRRIRRTRAIG